MTFENTPLINSAAIVRRAGATPYHGRQVISRLADEGRIKPVMTGTHRELLTLVSKACSDAIDDTGMEAVEE